MRRLTILALTGLLLLGIAGCANRPTEQTQGRPTEQAQGRPTDGRTAPTTPTTVSQGAVTFQATDGVTLHGTLYGTGATAVILSNMGDNDPGPWQEFAPLLAARGYQVLTYSFRYPLGTNAFTAAFATGTVPDLLGAVAFARADGATRIVLIGASLGGITVGKVGARAGAAAVVIISAEQDLSSYGLVVSAEELAALTVPKLFIASEQDTNTPYPDTKRFFDNAPEPKQFHGYPGGVHGVRLFATADGDDLRARLLDFVTGAAAA